MPLSQKEIKLIKSLQIKKYRKQHNLFVAEGRKLIEDLLESDLKPFKLLTTQPSDAHTYELIDEKTMKSISNLETPSSHFAVFKIPEFHTFQSLRPTRFFALHALQDPGNLGTILRSLDWFGPIPAVILSGTVDPFSQKVVQASMGSIGRVPMVMSDCEELSNYIKQEGIALLAAHMTGFPIDQMRAPEKFCIVIGNEGQGLADFPLIPDQMISIPPSPYSKCESLNASVAAGILAYWLFSASD